MEANIVAINLVFGVFFLARAIHIAANDTPLNTVGAAFIGFIAAFNVAYVLRYIEGLVG